MLNILSSEPMFLEVSHCGWTAVELPVELPAALVVVVLVVALLFNFGSEDERNL